MRRLVKNISNKSNSTGNWARHLKDLKLQRLSIGGVEPRARDAPVDDVVHRRLPRRTVRMSQAVLEGNQEPRTVLGGKRSSSNQAETTQASLPRERMTKLVEGSGAEVPDKSSGGQPSENLAGG